MYIYHHQQCSYIINAHPGASHAPTWCGSIEVTSSTMLGGVHWAFHLWNLIVQGLAAVHIQLAAVRSCAVVWVVLWFGTHAASNNKVYLSHLGTEAHAAINQAKTDDRQLM